MKLGKNKIYIYIEEYSSDDCSISLYDFIKEIIWEISFCGSPKNRDIKWEEIQLIEKDLELEKGNSIKNDLYLCYQS